MPSRSDDTEPWEKVEARRKAYEAETITRVEISNAFNEAIRYAEGGSDSEDRITSEISLTVVNALERVRDKLYDDMAQYR